MAANQRRRYLRQINLPEIGPAGQAKLASAGVLMVGLGGLGSPAALYLAAAGVGRLGLIDADKVSLDNLQRQILYGTSDIGRRKAEAAAERLGAINPDCRIETWPGMLSKCGRCIAGYDAVVDGTDSCSQVHDGAGLPRSAQALLTCRHCGQRPCCLHGISACIRCLTNNFQHAKHPARGRRGRCQA